MIPGFNEHKAILISKLLCLLIGHVPLNTTSISLIPISFSQFCFHIFNFLIFKINSIGSSSLFIGYVPLNTVSISIHSHFIFTFIFSWFIGNVLLSKICQRTRNTSSFVTSFTWASKSDLLPIRKITVFGLVRLRASVSQDERWLYVDLKKRKTRKNTVIEWRASPPSDVVNKKSPSSTSVVWPRHSPEPLRWRDICSL